MQKTMLGGVLTMPKEITFTQIGPHSKANDRPGLGMAALIVSRADDASIAIDATP